ncbi:MAG: hypothetical protein ACKPKO_00305, partial [Candidatus Fonsibacter sp.]
MNIHNTINYISCSLSFHNKSMPSDVASQAAQPAHHWLLSPQGGLGQVGGEVEFQSESLDAHLEIPALFNNLTWSRCPLATRGTSIL